MNPRTPPSLALAPFLATLALASCSPPGKKPTDADIAAYLGQSQPNYLRISNVSATFEAAPDLAGHKTPPDTWRVHVAYRLQTTQDLYAPTADARDFRRSFNAAVSTFEAMRVNRIAAVDRAATQAGLMKPGDAAPEPAMAVEVISHTGQSVPDSVTLLAEPDGTAWKFIQLDAQSAGDVGAPLADLRTANPHTTFVVAGSPEDHAARDRAARLMAALAKAGPPQ